MLHKRDSKDFYAWEVIEQYQNSIYLIFVGNRFYIFKTGKKTKVKKQILI